MAERPNILFIQSDQHRRDCTGYGGACPVQTPNIDRLAREGVWFEQAYTPMPLCCPARQALLNGKRPETFGALWNYDITLKIPALEPSEYSWTCKLKESGYNLGYVGKWHVHPHHDPTAYGFDRYISEGDYAAFRHSKHPDVRLTNGWFGEEDPVQVDDSRTHWLADRAVDLIRQFTGESKPWHIRLDFPEPHLPCQPAGEFARMYKPEDAAEWGSFRDEFKDKPYIQRQQLLNWGVKDYTWEDWAPTVARYYGIITQMDAAIGRVLDALDEMGLAENTIVIYTSDHGDMCGGHGMVDKHYVMYDDIVRVPLVVRWPGVVPEGVQSDKFVYNALDLPPTLLSALGMEVPEFFQGRSMLPILKGEDVSGWREEVVSTYNGQQFGLYTQRMIRNCRWKYVWNTTDVDELYDLESDPNELRNLIHEPEHMQVISGLRKKLYEVLERDGDELARSPWMKNQLLSNSKI